MLIYILMLAGIFPLYEISYKFKNPKKFFLIFSAIWIIAVFGSRYYINDFTDEITYNELYRTFSGMSCGELKEGYGTLEFGFYLLYWCFSKLISWPQFAIYFITAVCVSSFFYFIYKCCEDALLGVLIFMAMGTLSFYMAAYRQCFAMCLCLFALQFAINKKFIWFMIFCALAFTMHKTALLFLPIYWIIKIKSDMRGILINIGLIITVLCTSDVIMSWAGELFEKNYPQNEPFSFLGFFIQIAIMCLPFIFDLTALSQYDQMQSKKQHSYKVILSIGLSYYLLRTNYLAFERISYYYSFAVIPALSGSVISIKNEKSRKIIYLAAILLCVALFLWHAQSGLDFFWENSER